jgi:high-affinity iron transporter
LRAESIVGVQFCKRLERVAWLSILFSGIILLVGVLLAHVLRTHGDMAAVTAGKTSASAVLDIGVLVFREGLECILALAALTASLKGTQRKYQSPVSVGVGIAFVATLLTWCIAVRILDDIGKNLSALARSSGIGAARDSRSARRNELVLSQALLDWLDFA